MTRKVIPNRPKTMEGVPFRTSMDSRMMRVVRVSLAYSARYVPVSIPRGSAMIAVPTSSSNVPMMAGMIPPDNPPSVGDWVMNSQSITGSPFPIMYPSMTTSIRITTPITAVSPTLEALSMELESNALNRDLTDETNPTAIAARIMDNRWFSNRDTIIHTNTKTSTYIAAVLIHPPLL